MDWLHAWLIPWLVSPIDPSRPHDIGFALSWHARLMTLAWGILAPLAVLIARFFKVMPGQDWPRELDNQMWWRSHWITQSLVAILSVIGFGFVLTHADGEGRHGVLGYLLLGLLGVQVIFGIHRGTKGGPTARQQDGSLRGDHYDMTPHRIVFEHVHKTAGYAALCLAVLVILLGLWEANAPRWMWITLVTWWCLLFILGLGLQRKGFAIDTYQAIWGPDPKHPGNQRKPIGFGIRRSRVDQTFKSK